MGKPLYFKTDSYGGCGKITSVLQQPIVILSDINELQKEKL